MSGRRYREVQFVREFTNGFGLVYREYADSAGNRESVCLNPIIGKNRTPQEAAVEGRRRLGRYRRGWR